MPGLFRILLVQTLFYMKKSRLFLSIAALVLCAAAVWAQKTNKRFMLPSTLYYSAGDSTYTPFQPGRHGYLFVTCTTGLTPARYCLADGTCYYAYTYEEKNGYIPVCSADTVHK